MNEYKLTVYRLQNSVNGNPRFLAMVLLPAKHKGDAVLFPVQDQSFARAINGRWSANKHGYIFSTYADEYQHAVEALTQYTEAK